MINPTSLCMCVKTIVHHHCNNRNVMHRCIDDNYYIRVPVRQCIWLRFVYVHMCGRVFDADSGNGIRIFIKVSERKRSQHLLRQATTQALRVRIPLRNTIPFFNSFSKLISLTSIIHTINHAKQSWIQKFRSPCNSPIIYNSIISSRSAGSRS